MLLRTAADPFLQKIDVDSNLLNDVKSALGAGCFHGRLEDLKTRLQPMFVSLPKSSQNMLSHSAARYALHRISTDRHGWTISGLEPNLDNFNTSSLMNSGILRELLPGHIESIFAAHIGEGGFTLQSLAILSGTIDHLVREDQRTILRKACELLDVATIGSISEKEMRDVIQMYMVSFLRANMIPPQHYDRYMAKALDIIHKEYPGWPETVMLLDDERETFSYNDKDSANPFRVRESSLQVALRIVEQVADRFPHQQSQPECLEIKEDILAYERGETGRVRLLDFYRAGLDSRFFFTETEDYLRALGALDESDARLGPKVIVSNYVLAKSNCLAHAHLYSVCCLNECEGLYGQIEQTVASPEATPQQIGTLVATISSSTIQAPRNLSQMLLRRLDEIAIGHTGNVLLHSRLFAQWMHQAFPRECPYPHLLGTTTSLSPGDWAKQLGKKFSVGTNNLKGLVSSLELAEEQAETAPSDTSDDDADLMWTSEEEHFVEPVRSLSARVSAAVKSLGRGAVLLGLCTSLVFAFWASPRVAGGCKDAKMEQYFV